MIGRSLRSPVARPVARAVCCASGTVTRLPSWRTIARVWVAWPGGTAAGPLVPTLVLVGSYTVRLCRRVASTS